MDQVEQHTQPGLLRVAVLLSDSSRSTPVPNVSHLAWDYDLVCGSLVQNQNTLASFDACSLTRPVFTSAFFHALTSWWTTVASGNPQMQ